MDRNEAPCSRPTTNVIGPLHECPKKVCPCTKVLLLSGIRPSMKQGRRSERGKRETGKTEADGKIGSPTKQKPI